MKIHLECFVNAEPERTFAALSDLRGAPERLSAVKSLEVLTDGPVGQGTRWRETRVMFGKDATEEMEITAFDPPRSYTVEADSCGARFQTVIGCAPQGEGTLMTLDMTSRATTFMARLMTPLGLLFAGAAKKAMMKDFEDVKAHLESGDPVAAV